MRKLLTNFLCMVIFIMLGLTETKSQTCFYPDPNIVPISRYEQGLGGAKLKFDRTKEQFARMKHLKEVTFISGSISLIVDISFKASITGNLNNYQAILSQDYGGAGWYIYYIPGTNKIWFVITNSVNLEIADAPFGIQEDKYEIVYNKAVPPTLSTLKTYKNNILIITHNLPSAFNYTPDTNSAFGIGARNLYISEAPTFIGVEHFTGTFDDLVVKKDGETIVDVNFNWGAGLLFTRFCRQVEKS